MSAAKSRDQAIAGRYHLVRSLGGGAMASVWLAKTRVGTEVALKRMHPKLVSERMTKMFLEEARVASMVNHPNLCACLDVGEHEGEHFLALEYIEGRDLGDVIRRTARAGQKLPWEVATHIVREVLLALRALHEIPTGSVVHRDVAPDNIRISNTGAVKLIDFGVSTPVRECPTSTTSFKGKLGYAAPELVTGSAPSAQSDLYACGVVLWEALAGRRLFHAKKLEDAIAKARSSEVPPISERRPDVPEGLAEVIARALAAEPSERFASAGEMADALNAVLRAVEFPPDLRTMASLVASFDEPTVVSADEVPDRPSGILAKRPASPRSDNVASSKPFGLAPPDQAASESPPPKPIPSYFSLLG